MSDNLSQRLIRLAQEHPELRSELRPLLARAVATDIRWAAREIDKCMDKLEPVVDAMTTRGYGGLHEGGTSMADDYRSVAEAVNLIRKLSALPAKMRKETH